MAFKIAVLGRPRPRPISRPGRPRPNFFFKLSSSDVLVPVLVLVLDVLVLGRPPGRRGRGPSRPGTSRPAEP